MAIALAFASGLCGVLGVLALVLGSDEYGATKLAGLVGIVAAIALFAFAVNMDKI